MKKSFERIIVSVVYLFCFVLVIELGVNYLSFKYVFPIKNATSYGYITKKTNQVVIPLNKYQTRFEAQIALPYELVKFSMISKKELIKDYDKAKKKYGFIDLNNKVVIEYKYDQAFSFVNDHAIVVVKENNIKKYGTIDKKGNWVIEPKYSYLCPFAKYYTKACIDNKHCGIIDRFGNEVTLMTYKIDKLNCKDGSCVSQFCAIGKDKNSSCNYFL